MQCLYHKHFVVSTYTFFLLIDFKKIFRLKNVKLLPFKKCKKRQLIFSSDIQPITTKPITEKRVAVFNRVGSPQLHDIVRGRFIVRSDAHDDQFYGIGKR